MKRFQPFEFHSKKDFGEADLLESGKLANNMSRAKSRILALGMCND